LSAPFALGLVGALSSACTAQTDPVPSPKIPAPFSESPTPYPDTAEAPPAPTVQRACSGSRTDPVDDTWTVTVGNTVRTFEVHVPRSYDATQAMPLVLNFHGLGSNGEQQNQLSGMDAKADAAGFIAVHPEGLGLEQSWNAGDCCGFAHEADVDDIGFVSTMLDALEERLCIDPHRVFVTGMSNGAFFAERVGCELPFRVAAIAPVAGVRVAPDCAPLRAVPVMAFHGTLDPLVPYEGDAQIGLLSAPDDFVQWAARDTCRDSLEETYDDHDSHCESFEECRRGAEVTLCTIRGGGHTWPGGEPLPSLGYTTPYLSATDTMWTFFSGHALR
jgi:polyhydroxybutyrate depolymerase